MTNILLVPIHLDAFYTDGTKRLVAPLADYHNLPYYWATTDPQPHPPHRPPPPSEVDVNADNPFLSEMVMRPPANFSSDNYLWKPPAGLHLHWALPDALTSKRDDPTSNGQMRFPAVPNRWLVVCSTQSNSQWSEQQRWVVESDYLYPSPGSNPEIKANAISFPITPLETLLGLLTDSPTPPDVPTPDDINQHPLYYDAPFRDMGRCQALSDWQQNNPSQDEYLTHYRKEGLTAVGYGHSLFASVYSNCFSVFGLHDPATDRVYPRRYEVIGWYDDPQAECLSLFQHLQGQNLYDALRSEYLWRVNDTGGSFPTLSVYYAQLTIASPLQANDPNLSMNISVGNTGTEALSAYLAEQLAPNENAQSQQTIEEQLEAITLRSKLNNIALDLDAKFGEARHEKSFKGKLGGTLWSVQVRSLAQKASDQNADQAAADVTLPNDLADLLNQVNLAQAAYDRSWDEIASLRHRVFADWYRFQLHYNPTGATVVSCEVPPVSGTISYQQLLQDWQNDELPSNGFVAYSDDIVDYAESSSLKQLRQQIAATGKLDISQDEQGNFVLRVTDANTNPNVRNSYTLAQNLATLLQQLSDRLQFYNKTQAMQQAQRQYVLLRKAAPRYWQPADPVVLFEGESATNSVRYGADGRANDDNTLSCTYLNLTSLNANSLTQDLRHNGVNNAFRQILQTIEELSNSGGIGFQEQTQQPWNPIVLEWNVQVWPEIGGTTANAYNAGIDYTSNYIDSNYEFDVDAPDLRLKARPSQFSNPKEHENNYFGRTILTPHSTPQMTYQIAAYMMGISLYDLKDAASSGQTLSNELDYQLSNQLISWIGQYFTLTNVPTLQDPSHLNQQQIAEQQNTAIAWMKTQFPFRVKVNSQYQLVDLTSLNQNHPNWYDGKPIYDSSSNTLSTFGTYSPEQKILDPLYTAIRAYLQLGSFNVLSQALGGFNDALLTREQALQLPIWDYRVIKKVDPQAPETNNWRNYARDASLAIADGNRSAPLFDLEFLPIRSGLMKIAKLYLIDSFGQYVQITPKRVTKAESMTLSKNIAQSVTVSPLEDSQYIYLAPRLSQEARINFRWLAANQGTVSGQGDEIEMNDHPATSPVCGWFIPNNLDDSLMVYDDQGNALGSLVKAESNDGHKVVNWEPAPGVVNRLQVEDIPNTHLANLVSYLLKLASQDNQWKFWEAFLSAIDSALENIEPQNFAQHEALALLMGRPIAVVRAMLNLEVQGLPALNQSWWASLHDMCNQLYTGAQRINLSKYSSLFGSGNIGS
jgi:hypothetical protein